MRLNNGVLYLADGRRRPSERPGLLDCDGDWTIQLYRPLRQRRAWEVWVNVPRRKSVRTFQVGRFMLTVCPAIGYSVPATLTAD